jgi:hypothetical protein
MKMETPHPLFGPGFWDAQQLSRFFEDPCQDLFGGDTPPALWKLSFVHACLDRFVHAGINWSPLQFLDCHDFLANVEIGASLLFHIEDDALWRQSQAADVISASEAARVLDMEESGPVTLTLNFRKSFPPPFRHGFFAGLQALAEIYFAEEVSLDEMARLFHRIFLSWLPLPTEDFMPEFYAFSFVGGDLYHLFLAILQGNMGEQTRRYHNLPTCSDTDVGRAASLIAFAAFRLGHFDFPEGWHESLNMAILKDDSFSEKRRAARLERAAKGNSTSQRPEPKLPTYTALPSEVLEVIKARLESPDLSERDVRSMELHPEAHTWILHGTRAQFRQSDRPIMLDRSPSALPDGWSA